jgi:VWFA-related protein
MHAKLLLAIATGVALCTTLTAAHAQQPSTLHADIVSIVPADYPVARAVVNLDDTTGEAVKALTAANFTVTVAGKPAPVISADIASSQNAPLDVLLLMDISGSMAGEPIQQTKDAAKGLVQALGPADRVAVISFADSVTLVQDYSTDRVATQSAIDGLAASGNTALYDATAAAAYKAGTSGSSRRAIILLSDGAQDGVKVNSTRDQALAAAAGVGVPYFAIGEGTDIDRAYLTQLATASNGRYLEAPKATDLNGIFASIGQLLTSQFIVSFDASAAVGAADAPVTIAIHAGAASATAQGSFKPGPGFAPSPIAVSLSGVTEGESISEARTVTAVPSNANGITRVTFYVDGVNVLEADKPPYTFMFDPKSYGAAAHTLKAAALVGGTSFESAPVSFTSQAPAAAKGGGGGGLSLLTIAAVVAVLLVLLALIGIATVVLRRLRTGGVVVVVSADQRITPWVARHRTVTEPASEPDAEAAAAVEVEEIGEPLGVLVARAGPLAGTEYVVGGKPVGIGASVRCAVRIDDTSLSAEEARIWVRDGHLMLHRIPRITSIGDESPSAGWTILEPGDHLDIGDHRFEFRLWTPPVPLPDDEPAEVQEIPNVLRDPGQPRPTAAPPPLRAPAPSNLGVIWPTNGASPDTPAEAPDIDSRAS